MEPGCFRPPSEAAEYSLTDGTHAKLLGQLSDREFDRTSPELRADILEFYSDLSVTIVTKTDRARWQSMMTSLDLLICMEPGPTVASNSAP